MAKKKKESESEKVEPGNLREKVKSGEVHPSSALEWLKRQKHISHRFEKWLERRVDR